MLSNINDNQVNIDLRVLLPYDIPLSYSIISHSLASQNTNIISYKNSTLHKLPRPSKNHIFTIMYDSISPQEPLHRHLIKTDNIKPFMHPLA